MAGATVIRFRNIEPRFLDGIGPAEVKVIVSAARERRYLANSVIANQGHPAEHCFLLVSGRARYFYLTHDGRKVILRWIIPGEIFAPAALLATSVEYLVSTETTKNSVVLVWDRGAIRNLIGRYPQLIDNTLSIMFQYFLFYRDAHLSQLYDSAPQRLAHVLANLTSSIGKRVAGGVELDVRNDELASEANVTIFTVSRLLGSWQRKGILTKSRGKVVLSSTERLLLESD
jgi:CRP-like cAMP-binding protein